MHDNGNFQPDYHVQFGQNSNPVESGFEVGRINLNLRYFLDWSSNTEILNWTPELEEYELIAFHTSLSQRNYEIFLYRHKHNTVLLKAYRNNKGIFNFTALFPDKASLAVFKNKIANLIKPLEEDAAKPNVNFWYTQPNCGPRTMTKAIEVPLDSKIMYNYTSSIREDLNSILTLDPKIAEGGKLILFRGVPGTGKTYFIRHMMHRWRSWCNFQYVSDPENFFQNPAYLFEVTKFFGIDDDLYGDSGYGTPAIVNPNENKANLIVLEDAGEFIETKSTNEFVAKSLNKLLNITDGLLGQGLKLLILITTNQTEESLDPAILRSGRCLKSIEFPELSHSDVIEWLKINDMLTVPTTKRLLSDLYSLKSGEKK